MEWGRTDIQLVNGTTITADSVSFTEAGVLARRGDTKSFYPFQRIVVIVECGKPRAQ